MLHRSLTRLDLLKSLNRFKSLDTVIIPAHLVKEEWTHVHLTGGRRYSLAT